MRNIPGPFAGVVSSGAGSLLGLVEAQQERAAAFGAGAAARAAADAAREGTDKGMLQR